ncbi:AraC family transcriptional regulator [Rhizobium sp. 2YAF20]|uniref:AraC family transcriptional regulator n=1 Tax=Rhizobium sp. 2YAF20 TaxID=3233027 RepID=UPI003F9C77A7
MDIERLTYQPSRPYPYDVEVFDVSDLKRRTGADAMQLTYSYEFYMLILITRGECVQIIDFERVLCSAGTMLILRPGQAHNFGRSEDWEGWIVLFKPQILLPTALLRNAPVALAPEHLPALLQLNDQELRRASDSVLRMHEDSLIASSPETDGSLRSLGHEPVHLTADVHALLQFQLYALLTWLSIAHKKQGAMGPRHTGASQRFDRFRDLLEQRFAEWSRLSDYSKHLGCTEKSLTRATLSAVGMTAKALISKRINLEAKRLLAHTDLPIGVIAGRLGFQDAAHFSKFFKREANCTPKQFRTQTALLDRNGHA